MLQHIDFQCFTFGDYGINDYLCSTEQSRRVFIFQPYGNTVKPGTMTKKTQKIESRNENSNIKQFVVGKRYKMNSACDSDCWWHYEVISRTKSTITLQQLHEDGTRYEETKVCRINKKDTEFFQAEAVRPLGTYSMNPILTAEKLDEQQTEQRQLTLEFDEQEEEEKAVTIPLGDHGTLVIAGIPSSEEQASETAVEAKTDWRVEVRKEGVTPDGRELRIIERFNEEAISGGIFLVCDGEETEYATMETAETMFNDMVAQEPTPTDDEEPEEEEKEPVWRMEVRKEGVTPDGRDIRIVERYDEANNEGGVFLVCNGEETECSSFIAAETLYGLTMSQSQPTEAKTEEQPAKATAPSSNLGDMMKAAERSYGWSSFNPDRAARFMVDGYQAELDSDLAEVPAECQNDYISRFRAKVADIIAKNGRVASWAVTGPAGFNNRRNEKANNAYHNAVTAFEEWRKKVIAGYKRRAEAEKPAEQKMAEEWERVRTEIIETAASLKAIDEQGAPYTRSLFVSGLWGKLERVAIKGNVEIIKKATDLITELNAKMKKPIFTKRHLFWTLIDKAQERCAKIEETNNRESAVLQFEGYEIVRNFAEDRLQIIFTEIPSGDMRNTLKHNGFRWSPRNKAWQRQLTHNAEWACAQVFGKQRSEIFN